MSKPELDKILNVISSHSRLLDHLFREKIAYDNVNVERVARKGKHLAQIVPSLAFLQIQRCKVSKKFH